MTIRPDSATLIFLVAGVVQETKERLEKKEDEENNADDWMVLLKLEKLLVRWLEIR
jgi:hypothetical protein